jgi:hypothetical protein
MGERMRQQRKGSGKRTHHFVFQVNGAAYFVLGVQQLDI